jgi:hypothetical protein
MTIRDDLRELDPAKVCGSAPPVRSHLFAELKAMRSRGATCIVKVGVREPMRMERIDLQRPIDFFTR